MVKWLKLGQMYHNLNLGMRVLYILMKEMRVIRVVNMADWYSIEGKVGVNTLTCGVGDVITICHSNLKRGIVTGSIEGVINGFRMVYPDLGELDESTKGWNCIKYHHRQPGIQVLEFIEDRALERSTLEIHGGIMVHDHASIQMGGPAFATYYTEIEDEGAGT
jgi:hypothetical protein